MTCTAITVQCLLQIEIVENDQWMSFSVLFNICFDMHCFRLPFLYSTMPYFSFLIYCLGNMHGISNMTKSNWFSKVDSQARDVSCG